MEQGLYEQIINNIASQQLGEVDAKSYEVGKEKLDAEEARKLLSTYLAVGDAGRLKIR